MINYEKRNHSRSSILSSSESSSIFVCQYLITEGAILHIYDPKVSSERIFLDLSEQTGKNEDERKKIQSLDTIDVVIAF